MRIPNFEELEQKQIQQTQSADRDCISWGWLASGTRMHANIYFYKYYWQIFWKGSSCDGHEFLNSSDNVLTTKKAYDLRIKLESENLIHFIYNRNNPRLDSNNPFNPTAERWQGVVWAPAYDDDKDEIGLRGHK